MARNLLSSAATFYVAPTGNDATGSGSIASPWATPTGAYNRLQAGYDFGGQSVTVNVANGGYAEGCSVFGPIVGQAGATSLRFIGNLNDPSQVVIHPATNYGFGAAEGAGFSIAGFKIDMANGANDMISVGQGGRIWVINPSPGTIKNAIIFGTSAGVGYNDMSAAFGGKIFLDTWTKVTVDSTGDAISTTGTWTAGAGTVTVPDASNIKIGMAVRGAGIYPMSWVADKVGNVLSLNGQGTFASKTNEPITLTMSRQCHMDAGAGGEIINNTNGGFNLNAVELIGNPHYYSAFLLANGVGAHVSYQSIGRTGDCTGLPFCARDLGSIDTLATSNDPATYLPGTRVTKTASFAADVADITLSSNGGVPATATEVYPGAMVICSGKFRSPASPSLNSATSEATTVEMVKGAYGLGGNEDIRLSRRSIAAGTNAQLTFVGQIGQGGQYV